MTCLGLIWAQAKSGVIGRAGGIPWRLPEDQAHFKNVTMGATVVMGRLTWASLPAKVRPLPGRRNVVMTRSADFVAGGADSTATLQEVLTDDRVWVIGGGQIYALALPLADRCEVTEIDIDLPRETGDAMAPTLDESWVGAPGEWLTSGGGLRYRFISYRRS